MVVAKVVGLPSAVVGFVDTGSQRRPRVGPFREQCIRAHEDGCVGESPGKG